MGGSPDKRIHAPSYGGHEREVPGVDWFVTSLTRTRAFRRTAFPPIRLLDGSSACILISVMPAIPLKRKTSKRLGQPAGWRAVSQP